MKPVIKNFDINMSKPLNGGYKLGVLPAGFTVWTWHTSFVDGRPTVTFIGTEEGKPQEAGTSRQLP